MQHSITCISDRAINSSHRFRVQLSISCAQSCTYTLRHMSAFRVQLWIRCAQSWHTPCNIHHHLSFIFYFIADPQYMPSVLKHESAKDAPDATYMAFLRKIVKENEIIDFSLLLIYILFLHSRNHAPDNVFPTTVFSYSSWLNISITVHLQYVIYSFSCIVFPKAFRLSS